MSSWLSVLPKGTDLALWWIGWICAIALLMNNPGAKDIVLALGGGMVGFLTGRATANTAPGTPNIS